MDKTTAWYDLTAKVYDWTFDYPYHAARAYAIQLMQLQASDTIIDAGCGTGVNFSHYMNVIKQGKIYAIDASVGMLSKARTKIKKNQWGNIITLHKPLQAITSQDLHLDKQNCKVFFSLCLTAIDDWQVAFNAIYQLLPSGSIVVIMDIHHQPPSLGGRFLDFIASSDTSREVHKLLREWGQDYQQEEFSSFKFLDVKVVVAAAIKP